MTETIEEYVDRRLREEWPGTRMTRHGVDVFPEVRPGGRTDALIKMAAVIAGEYRG